MAAELTNAAIVVYTHTARMHMHMSTIPAACIPPGPTRAHSPKDATYQHKVPVDSSLCGTLGRLLQLYAFTLTLLNRMLECSHDNEDTIINNNTWHTGHPLTKRLKSAGSSISVVMSASTMEIPTQIQT